MRYTLHICMAGGLFWRSHSSQHYTLQHSSQAGVSRTLRQRPVAVGSGLWGRSQKPPSPVTSTDQPIPEMVNLPPPSLAAWRAGAAEATAGGWDPAAAGIAAAQAQVGAGGEPPTSGPPPEKPPRPDSSKPNKISGFICCCRGEAGLCAVRVARAEEGNKGPFTIAAAYPGGIRGLGGVR